MAFYFSRFPLVDYDIEKDNTFIQIQNPLVRFKILDILKGKRFLYLDYIIEEDESASEIAFNYYADETLDWVIYIVNDIIDPKYDWPLSYNRFNSYIINKYGSVENAIKETTTENIHHYEWIIQAQTTLFDGSILPEKVVIVDETKYDTLTASERRIVRNYEYEDKLNNDKRRIKMLKPNYLIQFLAEVRSVLA